MRFEFATAQRIWFGPGVSREVGPQVREWGRRILGVTGASPGRAEVVFETLEAQGIEVVIYALSGEPTLEAIERGVQQARAAACQAVVGLGGGSVLDAGKAIAALLANDGSLLDYLEVIGQGKPLARPSVPLLALPTTAGTGAEVTRNAVLTSSAHRVKASLRSPWLLPRLAVVDPELTLTVSPQVTANTGLDALTQLIEPYVSPRANPLTDGFCQEGIPRIARSLRRAVEVGTDLNAREDLSLASLLGGLALANSGLGAVHGLAAPLGGQFSAPHGAVCAALLAPVIAANVRALRQRDPVGPALARYAEIARLLTGRSTASADDGVEWIERQTAAFHLTPLRGFGVRREDYPRVIVQAQQGSSMRANPIVLTAAELASILESAW